ncbi:unnamed protein product, partial [Strongylus vulgaris]
TECERENIPVNVPEKKVATVTKEPLQKKVIIPTRRPLIVIRQNPTVSPNNAEIGLLSGRQQKPTSGEDKVFDTSGGTKSLSGPPKNPIIAVRRIKAIPNCTYGGIGFSHKHKTSRTIHPKAKSPTFYPPQKQSTSFRRNPMIIIKNLKRKASSDLVESVQSSEQSTSGGVGLNLSVTKDNLSTEPSRKKFAVKVQPCLSRKPPFVLIRKPRTSGDPAETGSHAKQQETSSDHTVNPNPLTKLTAKVPFFKKIPVILLRKKPKDPNTPVKVQQCLSEPEKRPANANVSEKMPELNPAKVQVKDDSTKPSSSHILPCKLPFKKKRFFLSKGDVKLN